MWGMFNKTPEILCPVFSKGMFLLYDYVDRDSLKDLILDNTDLSYSSPVQQTVLVFSLGQLEPQEAALEAAAKPLYRKLSLLMFVLRWC